MPDNDQSPWTMMGMNAAGSAAEQATGGLLGMLFAKENDRRQLAQQEKLQNLSIKGSKEMTDYQKMKELEMWKATSYPAQMEMLKQAGLNPGLMYGMGGGGGQSTGGGGATVGMGHAPAGGGEIMGMALGMRRNAAELELVRAQTDAVRAEAEKKKEETKQLGGIDLENKELQVKLLKLQESFKAETLEADINRNHYETNQQMHEAAMKYNDRLVSDAGAMTKAYYAGEIARADWEKANQEVINLTLQGLKTKEDTKLTTVQIEKIKQDIQNEIRRLEQGDRALDQKDQDILIDKARNSLIETGIWVGAATGLAGDLIKMYTGGKAGTVINKHQMNIYKKD